MPSVITFPLTNDIVRHEIFESEPWFHAGDVCKILGFKNPAQTIDPIENDNKRKLEREYVIGTAPWFIDEEALYTIVLRCQGALEPGTVAYQFRKWVITVIKEIRKTGQYTAIPSDQQHFTPFGITIQQKIQECDRALETAPVGTGKIKALLADKVALQTQLRLEQSQTSNLQKDALGGAHWTLILNQASINFDRSRFSAVQFLHWALNANCKDEGWDDAIAWLRDVVCPVNATDKVSVRTFGRWLVTHQNSLDSRLYLVKAGTLNRIGFYKVSSVGSAKLKA